MNSKTAQLETEFSEFLVKRICNAGGSIQLQHITGHMSQVRSEVRSVIGSSLSDLKLFLRNHENLFCIDTNKNVVSLANSLATSEYDSDNCSTDSQTKLPSFIPEGRGVIVKLFPSYGFIKSKEPIKTEIYFRASDMKNSGNSNIDLTSFLYTGANIYFSAKKKASDDARSKYTAIKVWRADNSKPEDNIILQKSRKNRDTGLYDPLTLDGEGIIQKVFPDIGFIAVNGDENNTVFFHKSRIANYGNIVDLTKVLLKGDTVDFNAHRSTKSDAKARWEATKVWKKSGKAKQNICMSDSSQNNDKLSLNEQPISNINNKAKETIKNYRGKICPRSKGAVIKFGKNELADGNSALYFVSGTRVTDISWNFSEGDDVKFDAVKIESAPGWKATLVWEGEKPDITLPKYSRDFNEFTDEENEFSSSIYTSKSSSCSVSSNSSIKSVSIKSESIDSKRNVSKQKTKLSDFAVNKMKDRKANTHYLSQNSLNSSDSNNCEVLRKNASCPSNKFVSTYSNWGDSPYPDADSEDILTSKYDTCDEESIENNYPNTLEVPDNEQYTSKYLSCSASENSDEETDTCNNANFVKMNNIDTFEAPRLKEKACIIKFHDIKGKITKVYSKYAEVKSCNLQNIVSFFWNDFYTNTASVEELGFDDLKQVLAVGDIIYLNYFTIVDDLGHTWQKVTLAWNGSKPKVHDEISPEDFIKQKDLSVTVNNEFDQENSSTSTQFLIPVSDVDDVNSEVSISEPSTQYNSAAISVQNSEVDYSNGDFKKLSSMIYKILQEDIFSVDSKIDPNSVSEEIIHLALENHYRMKHNIENSNSFSHAESSMQSLPDICSKCRQKCTSYSSQDNSTTDSFVQTFITGDIITQKIYTEC